MNRYKDYNPSEKVNFQEGLTGTHTEEIQDVISSIPPWIIRWGITLIVIILFGIVTGSAFIEYPDIIRTEIKIHALNSPKVILSKQNAKLVTVLVSDGEMVKKGQPLAYFESNANPEDVLKLSKVLSQLQSGLGDTSQRLIDLPRNLELGELQSSYQVLYEQYLQYLSTQKDGYYMNQISLLEKELSNIKLLGAQIIKRQNIENQEYKNHETEYKMYKQLYEKKVISNSEFIMQQNKFLASKYPLQQSKTSIIGNSSLYTSKRKELLDLHHVIMDQQHKFIQTLNQCISDNQAWILKYILRAPINGRLNFAGIIQQNQNIAMNQEVFVVQPENTDFFGEAQVSQYNMGKLLVGQRVLLKVKSYPFEQFGFVKGKLSYISRVAYRDSVFIAKVSLERLRDPAKIILKNGMLADGEIITEENSLLQRFFRNIVKMINGI